MADVRLSTIAAEDLNRLVLTHSLPDDTRTRVARSLRPLERFPLIGRALEGRWQPFRLILGPWRWMLILYAYDQQSDTVLIATIQDARSTTAATNG